MDSLAGTNETVKDELSIFNQPSVQVTHSKAYYDTYIPSNAFTELAQTNTGIIVTIPKMEGVYTDFNDSFIYVKFKIVTKAGTDIGNSNKVALSNLAISSLFKDVSMQINGVKIEGENQLYPYKAYLYNLLSAGESAKKHQLQVCGWVTDEAGKFDHESNAGYVARKAWTATSKVVEFCGPLWLDCWMQPQYMIPNVELRFYFQKAKPEFVLHAFDTEEYDILYEKFEIHLRHVIVNPSVSLGHESGLDKYNAVYPYNGHKVIQYGINAGVQSYTNTDLCQNLYPKLIIIGLLTQKAFMGSLKSNPFNFQHFNVNYCGLTINGQNAAFPPYKPNFGKGHIMREYLMMYLGLGKAGIHADDMGIKLVDFFGGNTFFVFI